MSAELGCEVVVTRGGARAMRDLRTGEVMHPVVGPRVEAAQLYVAPARLAERLESGEARPLVLFDVGLGAGSNAAAALHVALATAAPARRLEIVSFERDLTALTLALAPEHAQEFGLHGEVQRAASELLAAGSYAGERVRWRLARGDLLEQLRREPPASADVVFWDPFSPRANPSLWTVGAFALLRRTCRPGATVHTYSAATATRAALLLAGFAVGYGPPIGEKAHTTMAAVDLADLPRPLDARWFQRLTRSSAPFPPDASADALERLRAHPQF